ncbi:hypothetical protein HHI36_007179 [Cryptolaemus montrouzieri]|uniref:CRAL-TRIO domain-containing protein n=1 Tax=Cryptolaemus montrouzieri TaxID=559131 RepID=A0ABD2MNV3_9CUCU
MSDVYICQLPAEVQKYAAEVLNETEESRQNAFKEIKEWAASNQYLHVRTEEKYILPFLRCCKFNIERTKEKMKNFYVMRRERSEWFTNRNPNLSQIQQLVKNGSCLILKKTHENHLVVIIRPTVHDPKRHGMDDVLKCAKMILDIGVMEEELSQVYGVIVIIDMANVSFAHARQLSISRIKHMVYAWQNYHCRPKKMEFVNAPAYINVVLDVFKSFMSEKLRKRVTVRYDGIASVVNIVDKAILPCDYGGEDGSLEELGRYWNEKLRSYTDWFVEDEQYKADLVK